MNKEELINKLIEYFYNEDRSLIKEELDDEDKREYLDEIIASREPKEIDPNIIELESKLLTLELQERKIVNAYEIDTINRTLLSDDEIGNVVALWQGDITRLKVDAIINSTNNTLVGCNNPSYKCIDHLINSRAGIGLKLECYELMKDRLQNNNIGIAKITGSYNLPCKYIIHTTGPKVHGDLTEENKNDLKQCYLSILELAKRKELKTIAIPCISTGENHFPKKEAASIAFNTIKEFILANPYTFNKIIINVFSNEDYNEYKKLV